jgi:hypothetical protein
MEIKKQFAEKPLTAISTIVGITAGIIGIITFSIASLNDLGKYIVTDEELKEAETRVIAQIRTEAIITRNVIVGEILVRKRNLQRELENTEDAGKIAVILEKIKVLNQRLDKIRGIDE